MNAEVRGLALNLDAALPSSLTGISETLPRLYLGFYFYLSRAPDNSEPSCWLPLSSEIAGCIPQSSNAPKKEAGLCFQAVSSLLSNTLPLIFTVGCGVWERQRGSLCEGEGQVSSLGRPGRLGSQEASWNNSFRLHPCWAENRTL